MLRLYLALLVTGAVCLTPENCDVATGDELEYICPVHNASITFSTKKNDYVNIRCEGINTIKCTDLPLFDFASGLPLKSVGISYCPPSILPCVNKHILASSLEIVTLTNMTGPVTKEDLETLGAVRVLIMGQAGSETSLPIAATTAFPTLRRLTIGGGNFQLVPRAFEQSAPITYLELYKDQITSIPSDSFQGLSSVQHLNMWANPLQNISVGAFRGLVSLHQLSLSNNKLSSIEVGAFSDIPTLKSLYLMANWLNTIPAGLLNGLDHLENITILMNLADLRLQPESLSDLPSLKNVIIKQTKLRHLPDNLFKGSTGIMSIQLMSDFIEDIHADVFLKLSELRRLDLSFNKIKELPEGLFRGLKNLEYLNMNRNFIEVLPEQLFDGMSHLKEIHFDFNNISTIGWTSFVGARNLHTLSLAHNQLTLDPQNPSYYGLGDSFASPFNALVALVKLNLSHNKIMTMYYDWEAVLLQLEYLDLSYNLFKVIEFDNYAINFLNSKLTVDLRYNKITTVIFDKPTHALTDTKATATLLVDHNPFNCDCSMYGFKVRANGTRYASNEPMFVLDHATCSSPPELQGDLITEVSPNDLICSLPEILPKSCTKCVAKVASNELVLNCDVLPKLPDTKSPNISYYFIKEPTITVHLEKAPVDLYEENIHTLNLSSIGIKEIDFHPTEDLKILDVSNNLLSTIPMEFLSANITLYLANNPLECECWYADDISALQRYVHLADLSGVTCANGDKLALIDTTSLCNTWKASMAALGTFIVLGVCVLISAVVIHRFSNEILIYMTTRGICKCCVKEILIDKDKEYDVFISYAHLDVDLVKDTLLPILEKELHQKVCIHERDWIVGEMIPTQILRSVENSKRTVIVLSKNFLESVWANLEFSAAHNLALQEGKARVILIVLDESLTKHASLSEDLKAYIATNTYLLWQDPKFCEKLRKVLPKKKHVFTWIDALKQRSSEEEKEGIVGLDVQLNNDGKLVNVAKKIVNDGLSLPHQFV